jgi:hypothetical protein
MSGLSRLLRKESDFYSDPFKPKSKLMYIYHTHTSVANIPIFRPKISIMKVKDFITRFLLVFVVSLIVNILITICWDYFVKGDKWVIDWETSLRFALLFAIVIPLTQIRRK